MSACLDEIDFLRLTGLRPLILLSDNLLVADWGRDCVAPAPTGVRLLEVPNAGLTGVCTVGRFPELDWLALVGVARGGAVAPAGCGVCCADIVHDLFHWCME